MTSQHTATYQAYLAAQGETNAARGASQPTLGNAPGTARLAALDAAAAEAWDRHRAAVLDDPELEA